DSQSVKYFPVNCPSSTMCYRKIINIFISFLIVCCSSHVIAFSQAGEVVDLSTPRIWTAVTGHQLKATYEGRDGDKIRLLVDGGKVKTVLLEKLSEADRRLLNEAAPEKGKGRLKPILLETA
ncbi:MAG: hypothetical protein LUE13_04570, partial [Akkermansiaceae bacterium]|nr:hypothetical protein [Akkermansiaceae bacterium]